MPGPFDFADAPATPGAGGTSAARHAGRGRDVRRPPSHSLGIASMAVGLATLPMISLARTPPLAIAALALSCVGFLLGLLGLVGCLARRGYGIGYPVAGIAANGLAGALLVLALAGVFGEALAKVREAARRAGEKQATPAAPVK